MLERTIHLLLIPAILGCPLFCTGGAGGVFAICCDHTPSPARTDHPRPAACCAAHAADFPQTAEDEPVPPDEAPADHLCQCICGGAIRGDDPTADELRQAPLECGGVLPAPVSSLRCADDSTASQLLLRIGDRTVVSGRHLRHLYMSLLC